MPSPNKLLILRHAEKPESGSDLSTSGFIRAAALGVFLPTIIKKPGAIFATRDSENSDRPLQTITPYAQAVRVDVDGTFKDSHYDKLAEHLLSDSKYNRADIVVCWHHGKIPELAAALGVQNPPKWDPSVFDRLWLIEFGGAARLSIEPQRLLFGDSET